MSITEDFLLVDTWMLWQRFKEEITQTEKEMCSFMESIQNGILDLTASTKLLLGRSIKSICVLILFYYQLFTDLMIDNETITPFNQGKVVLQNTEIVRLNNVLADCLLYFDVQTEEEFLAEIDSISDDIVFELQDSLLSRWIQKEEEEIDEGANATDSADDTADSVDEEDYENYDDD